MMHLSCENKIKLMRYNTQLNDARYANQSCVTYYVLLLRVVHDNTKNKGICTKDFKKYKTLIENKFFF